jgi:hypothetical protein
VLLPRKNTNSVRYCLIRKALGNRAKELRKLCEVDPASCSQAILDKRLAEATAAAAGPDGCLEEPIQISGTINTVAVIGQASDYSSFQTITIKGKDYKIRSPFKDLPQDTELKGWTLGNDLILDPNEAPGNTRGVFLTPTWPTTGDLKKLVVMVSYNDSPSNQSIAQKQLEVAKQARFVDLNSYGKARLLGTVYPQKINIPETAACSPGDAMTQLLRYADTLIDFSQYHWLTMVSSYPACSWGGIAYLGTVGVTTNDGNLSLGINQTKENMWAVDMHEDGHSLGLHHGADYASTEWFPVGGLASPGTTWTEYQTLWNLMGRSGCDGVWGALHKWYLGWMVEGVDILINPAPGTYVLNKLSSPTGLKALCFHLNSLDYLCFDYHQNDNEFENTCANLKQFNRVTVYSSFGTSWPHEGHHRLLPDSLQDAKPGDVIQSPNGTRVRIDSTGVNAVVTVLATGTTDTRKPTAAWTNLVWDQLLTGTVRATASLTDDNPYGIQFFFTPPGGRFTALGIDTVPPYTVDIVTTNYPDGRAFLYAQPVDTTGQIAGLFAVAVNFNNGGSVTTSTSTSTSSTTTRPPVEFHAVIDSHLPNPSFPGQPVTVCGHAEKDLAVFPIDRWFVGTQEHCMKDGPPFCCNVTLQRREGIAAYAYSNALGTWSAVSQVVMHDVIPNATTTIPPTTTTSTSSSTTSRPSTTSSSTSSSSSTSRPTTTSSSTTTVRPSTTIKPTTTTLRGAGQPCTKNSQCASGKCRGGRNKVCQGG